MWSWTSRLGLGALVALVGVYVIAVLTVPGQWLDDQLFGLAQQIPSEALRSGLKFAAREVLPPVMVLVTGLVAGWALVCGRVPQVLIPLVVPLVSVPLARSLRAVLPRPDHGFAYDFNTLPSTHVAVVAATVVAVPLMWPAGRPVWLWWALGAVLIVACLGNVVGHAHRPSDVLASPLLVLVVAAAVQTRLPAARLRPHGQGRHED